MADSELRITSSFDATGITVGLDQAASEIEGFSSQLQSALVPSEEAFQELAGSVISLLESLGAVEGSTSSVAGSIESTGNAATAAGEQFNLFGGGVLLGIDNTAALSESLDGLLGSLGAVGEIASVSANNLIELGEAETLIGSAAAEAAGQMDLFVEGLAVANAEIAAVPAALAEANGQLLLFTEAAAEANGQMLLFEQQAAGTAAAEAELAAATAAAAASVEGFVISVGEGVTVSAAMQQAIDLLNNKQAVASSTSQELATAWKTLTAGAERLNLEVVKTAAGFEILKQSQVNAATGSTGLERALAGVTGRLLGVEIGAGGASYALSVLGRALAPLSVLFAAAFPVIFGYFAIEMISQMIDKIHQLQLDLEKTGRDFEELATATIHQANAMEIANLKIEDSIAKLEGRPTKNTLVEALIEVRDRAEEVAKSLADAEQKALTLLETKSVGAFKAQFTAFEPTKDISNALEGQLSLLATLRTKQAELALDGTEDQKKAIAAQVEQQRQLTLNTLDELKKRTAAQKTEDLRRANQSVFVVEGQQPSKEQQDTIKAKVQEINNAYSLREGIISNLTLGLKEEVKVEEQATKEAKDRLDLARAQQTAEAARRTYAIEDPRLKQAEKNVTDQARLDKEVLENKFNAAVAEIQKEGAEQILAGKNKLVVEQDVIAKTQVLRKQLADDEITLKRNELTQLGSIYDQEAELIKKTKFGVDQTKDLEANEAAKQKIIRDGQAEISSIRIKAETADTREQKAELDKQVEQQRQALQELVTDTRQGVQEKVTAIRDTEREAVGEIQAGAESQLRIIRDNEQEKTTSILKARDARIRVYDEENTEIQKQLEAEKVALRAQQDYVELLIASLPAGSAAIKELTNIYNQLAKAIEGVTAAQDKFNTKLSQQKTDTQTDALKELTAQYDRMLQGIGDKFANFTTGLLTGTEKFRQAWGRMVLQFEGEFIQSLFRQLARHIAVEAAKVAATQTSQSAQTASTTAGEGLRMAISNSSLLQFIKNIILLITHHTAGETTKTAATVASQAAQTAATGAGTAARSALLIAATTAETTAAAAKSVINVAQGMSYAALAAAGTLAYYSAFAPEIAEPMAAVAFAEGATWAGLAAFERGTDMVPATGIALVHQGERILPASMSGTGASGIGNTYHTHHWGGYNPTINNPTAPAVDASEFARISQKRLGKKLGVKL